jgi:glycosyltransferase involved in cell wall biosynthesis
MINLAIVGLYLGPGSFGGVYNYTKLLIKYIDKNKFNIHYYSLGKSPNWYSGEDKPTLIKFILYQIKMIIFFFYFLKKNKIDIAHLNSGLTQISLIREGILSIIAKFIGCKTLFFIHGWKEEDYNIILKSKFKKRIFINFLNKQNGIIVLGEIFKKELVDLGVNKDKIFTSSTMVESDKFISEKIVTKPLKILFCANIVKEKGPFELLKSAPVVLNYFPDVKFIFVGNGKDIQKLKILSEELEIKENIEFTGYVDMNKKIKLFKDANIFAFPSYYGEGFPTVILEAMAAGLPVITTSNAGLIGAIEDGREGFLLKTMPSEPEEIAEKIIELIKNPDLLRKISQNNVKTAQKQYDTKVISNQISRIYNQI